MDPSAARRNTAAVPTILAAPVVLFAAAYTLAGLFRHWHFGSNAYDLGIFDQAVWHLSRFEAPASTISGFTNVLGDHFYPIIAAFAPLYWVAPAPETLIVAQAILFALSAIPVFLYLRDRLPQGPALTLTCAYGLFWGMQRAVVFDVHEVAFAPLIIATAILALDRRRWGVLAVALGALMLVKEDLIPVAGFFGLLLILDGRRRAGLAVIAICLLVFLVVVTTVIPGFNEGQFSYRGAYAAVAERPWQIPATLVTPPVKIRTAVLWLLPFLFLPLRSPLAILLVPFVLSRFLSTSPNHWGTIFHYSAPLAPILAMAAGDGLSRLARGISSEVTRVRAIRAACGASLVLCAVLPGNQPLWEVFSPRHYRAADFHATGHDLVARIPDGASVVAMAEIVPHLSRREQIYILKPDAPDADYVLASTRLSPWPLESDGEVAALLAERRARGYTVEFEGDSWVLLRRPR